MKMIVSNLALIALLCLINVNLFGQCPDDPGEGFLGTCSPSLDDGKTVCAGQTVSAVSIGCGTPNMPSDATCCPPSGASTVYYLIYECGTVPANPGLPNALGIEANPSNITSDPVTGLDSGLLNSPILSAASSSYCLTFIPYLSCTSGPTFCIFNIAGTCEPIDVGGATSIHFAGPNGTGGDGSCSPCPIDHLGLSGTENGTGGPNSNGDYETDGPISSTQQIISGIVDYDSNTIICLDNGFEVVLGSLFSAFIDGCNGTGGEINP